MGRSVLLALAIFIIGSTPARATSMCARLIGGQIVAGAALMALAHSPSLAFEEVDPNSPEAQRAKLACSVERYSPGDPEPQPQILYYGIPFDNNSDRDVVFFKDSEAFTSAKNPQELVGAYQIVLIRTKTGVSTENLEQHLVIQLSKIKGVKKSGRQVILVPEYIFQVAGALQHGLHLFDDRLGLAVECAPRLIEPKDNKPWWWPFN